VRYDDLDSRYIDGVGNHRRLFGGRGGREIMIVTKKTRQVAKAIYEADDQVDRACHWDRLAPATQDYYIVLANAAVAAFKAGGKS
jgi:hypothetical protein